VSKIEKYNIILDFDGLIHLPDGPITDAKIITGKPVEGIRELITELREDFIVNVVSTRCYTPGGIAAIENWNKAYSIFVDSVTAEKPIALFTVDDRCIPFNGDIAALRQRIKNFRVWTKKFKDSVPVADWKGEVDYMVQCPQRQDSSIDQLRDLISVANKLGFCDAADIIEKIVLTTAGKKDLDELY